MAKKLNFGGGGIRMDLSRIDKRMHCVRVDDAKRVRLSLGEDNAELMTAIGNTVLVGQPVARTENGYIYSSVSGTVTEIGEYRCTSGTYRSCITVESDGRHASAEPSAPSKPLAESSAEDLVELAVKSGLFDRDGYPLSLNISESAGKVERCVINAVPRDKDDRVAEYLMNEYPQRFICGVKIILKAIGIREATVVLPTGSFKLAEKLKDAAYDDDCLDMFKFVTAPNRYPFCDDARIIYALGGPSLPPGHRPFETGYAVFDAVCCVRLFESFAEGLPITDVYLSLSGKCLHRPCILCVPCGAEFSLVAENCGGFAKKPLYLISGGRMRGVGRGEDDIVGASDRQLRFERALELPEEQDCIRCGRCISACPSRLVPFRLSQYCREEDAEGCRKYHIEACTGCGCCSYVCPSGIPLARNIRRGRYLLTESGQAGGAFKRKRASVSGIGIKIRETVVNTPEKRAPERTHPDRYYSEKEGSDR